MMRVTSQMLDKAAAKSGLPIRRASLLDYIDNPAIGSNPLLDSLGNSGRTAVNSVKREEYEKLGKAADKLFQSAGLLTADGEKSVFAEAKRSGDAAGVYDEIDSFVKNYNGMLNALKSSSSPLNDYYRAMLKEAAKENDKVLSGMGIVISEDGVLSLDKEKLKEADLDSLEKVFGASGTFAAKAEFLAARVALNAQAGVESISNQYNFMGNSYSASFGKYDFWG